MIISGLLKNGISVDRSLCTSTYRDYSRTTYRDYGKSPCLLHISIDALHSNRRLYHATLLN